MPGKLRKRRYQYSGACVTLYQSGRHVRRWREMIAEEDAGALLERRSRNWVRQSGHFIDISATRASISYTRLDTVQHSHTERSTLSVSVSPPVQMTHTQSDTIRTAGSDSIRSGGSLTIPLGIGPVSLGSITLTHESARPVTTGQ